MKTQFVKVLRSFRFESAAVAKNEVVELPLSFAQEMRSAHKVEFVDPPKQEPEKQEKAEPKQKSEFKATKLPKGD